MIFLLFLSYKTILMNGRCLPLQTTIPEKIKPPPLIWFDQLIKLDFNESFVRESPAHSAIAHPIGAVPPRQMRPNRLISENFAMLNTHPETDRHPKGPLHIRLRWGAKKTPADTGLAVSLHKHALVRVIIYKATFFDNAHDLMVQGPPIHLSDLLDT
jgi:hypothetical protein